MSSVLRRTRSFSFWGNPVVVAVKDMFAQNPDEGRHVLKMIPKIMHLEKGLPFAGAYQFVIGLFFMQIPEFEIVTFIFQNRNLCVIVYKINIKVTDCFPAFLQQDKEEAQT